MASKNKFGHYMVNWIPKIFSFLFALFIVLSIRFLNIGDRVVTIPLEVSLPSEYKALSLVPDSVDISIKGNDEIIYFVDPAEIHASADFSSVKEDGITRVPVHLEYNGDIFRRNGLVVEAHPSTVRILFESKPQ